MTLLRNGKLTVADPRRVLDRLGQLHVPVQTGRGEAIRSYIVCAYDGFIWPCRERRIMEGYEEEL